MPVRTPPPELVSAAASIHSAASTPGQPQGATQPSARSWLALGIHPIPFNNIRKTLNRCEPPAVAVHVYLNWTEHRPAQAVDVADYFRTTPQLLDTGGKHG